MFQNNRGKCLLFYGFFSIIHFLFFFFFLNFHIDVKYYINFFNSIFQKKVFSHFEFFFQSSYIVFYMMFFCLRVIIVFTCQWNLFYYRSGRFFVGIVVVLTDINLRVLSSFHVIRIFFFFFVIECKHLYNLGDNMVAKQHLNYFKCANNLFIKDNCIKKMCSKTNRMIQHIPVCLNNCIFLDLYSVWH